MADQERDLLQMCEVDRAYGAGERRPDLHSGTLFWVRRLKRGEHGSDWSLPYGDLMSLLLAVFVMIAAMSELKSGPRYAKVAGGVQRAFGFSAGGRARRERAQALGVPLSLLEQLERIDLRGGLGLRASDGTGRALAPCEVRSEPGRVVLRIPGQACFADFAAELEPGADRLLVLLADYLKEGRATLEIRVGAGPDAERNVVMLRDGCDLAYERARACAQALIRGGVDAERIRLLVAGRIRPGTREPSVPQRNFSSLPADGLEADVVGQVAPGAIRDCVEIVVWTGTPASGSGPFADEERDNHG